MNRDDQMRLTVFDHFLRDATPPSVEQLMSELRLSRDDVERGLDRLEKDRHLQLVPRTHRILMAFPFSAIATPFRVYLNDGRAYFANCAWDAVAFHVMLRQPVRIHSFCHHCGNPILLHLTNGSSQSPGSELPLVYLDLPAAAWWNDIIATCSNSMVFFQSTSHLREWQTSHPGAQGAALAVDTVVRLSEPLYSGKLAAGYSRPPREQLVATFQELGLAGKFWEI